MDLEKAKIVKSKLLQIVREMKINLSKDNPSEIITRTLLIEHDLYASEWDKLKKKLSEADFKSVNILDENERKELGTVADRAE